MNKAYTPPVNRGHGVSLIKFLLILWCLLLNAPAFAATLINYSSPEGLTLLRRDLNQNITLLLAHFTTQNTLTYCGVASAVIVLNSLKQCSPPAREYPSYRYFTQENFFNSCVRKIATPNEVSKRGLHLDQLATALNCHGAKTMPYYSKDLNLDKVRQIIKSAVAEGDFIIINFVRTQLHQHGGGHFSPVAAYDPQTDRVLILDTARYKYQPYWAPLADVWHSTATCDDKKSRGFIIIKR